MSKLMRVVGALMVYVACMVAVNASTRTIAVTDYQCGRKHTIDEETLFVYSGEELSFPCEIELDSSNNEGVCVTATTYDTACNIKLEYYEGIVFSGYADKEVDCYSSDPKERFCTSYLTLNVVFDIMGSRFSYLGTSITLKVEKKSDNTISSTAGAVIGGIVGILILLGIVTVIVVVVCRFRKRRHAAGMVYNNPQQMPTPVLSQAQYAQGPAYPTQPYPQQQYPPPQQYNMPGNQPALPQQQYNMLGNQPAGPQQQYNMPGNQPAGPQQQYNVPGNQPAGPQQQYNMPGNQPAGPQQQYNMPGNQPPGTHQYPAPGNQPMDYSQPLSGFTSPTVGYGAGYQPPVPPSYNETEKLAPSAPTMPDDFSSPPPPYPGN